MDAQIRSLRKSVSRDQLSSIFTIDFGIRKVNAEQTNVKKSKPKKSELKSF